VASDCDGVRVDGDWLAPAGMLLLLLQGQMQRRIVTGAVTHVTAKSVTLDSGEVLKADHVAVAAGFGAASLAAGVPSLEVLSPIKGHLLALKGQGTVSVLRSPLGYLADHIDDAKFGATMQFGRSDVEIESQAVDDLKARAKQILPDLDLTGAQPKAGVRASTPDGWPMIGLDRASGVLVAVGMRRNGYIFAPLAARIVTALILGDELPDDAELYRPERF